MLQQSGLVAARRRIPAIQQALFGLAAHGLADQFAEAAFCLFAELIVLARLFTHHEAPAAIASVEPQRTRSSGATRAVETNPGSHLDKRSALWELRRFFVLDADQRETLVTLKDAHRADRDFISGGGLADHSPISSGEQRQADQQHWCEHDSAKNEEGLFQSKCGPPERIRSTTVGENGVSVNRAGPRLCSHAMFRGAAGLSFKSRCPSAVSMETLHSTVFNSPVGPLFLAASNRGLVALEFDARLPGQQTIRPNPRDLRTEGKTVRFEESGPVMLAYARELEEYFAGQRREFSFPLDLRGTEFQRACWRALIAIPYGETRTYADIARAVGRPQGFRAVGMANNRNPVAIVVPCHRVIASDGTLCGYGGGLDVKRKLLELEGALSGTLAA